LHFIAIAVDDVVPGFDIVLADVDIIVATVVALLLLL
jgi:hypothetical protein